MKINDNVEEQSSEMSSSVHLNKTDKELGDGDQGIMFGYVTNEWDNETLMPLSRHLCSTLAKRFDYFRRDGTYPYLRPDCTTQISVEYKKETEHLSTLKKAHTVLIS